MGYPLEFLLVFHGVPDCLGDIRRISRRHDNQILSLANLPCPTHVRRDHRAPGQQGLDDRGRQSLLEARVHENVRGGQDFSEDFGTAPEPQEFHVGFERVLPYVGFQFVSGFPVADDPAGKIRDSFGYEGIQSFQQKPDSFEVDEPSDERDSRFPVRGRYSRDIRYRHAPVDGRDFPVGKFLSNEFTACLTDSDDRIGTREDPFSDGPVERSGGERDDSFLGNYVSTAMFDVHPLLAVKFRIEASD